METTILSTKIEENDKENNSIITLPADTNLVTATVPLISAGSGITITNTGDTYLTAGGGWTTISLGDSHITNVIKNIKIRGFTTNGNYTPKRCYE